MNVLLIEDNPGDAFLVQEMFSELLTKPSQSISFKVIHQETLKTALACLQKTHFDILLVDLSLPDSQGLDTVKKICEIAPTIPFIVLSGLADEKIATAAVKEGAQDYLLKGNVDSQLLFRSIQYAIERKKNDLQLKQLAYFDPITDLANRYYFMQLLKQMLNMARRYHWLTAILFIDLNGFKLINDTFGHESGDRLLKTVANRLSSRSSDIVSRFGGDEFVIVLNKVKNISEVSLFAQKILKKIKEPITVNDHQTCITASIGISLFPHDGTDLKTLLKKADMAMYRAKETGKGNYHFFEATIDKQVDRQHFDEDLHSKINPMQQLNSTPTIKCSDGEILNTATLPYQILHAIGNAVLITDHENKIIFINQRYTEITGYTGDEVIGKNPNVLSSGKQDKAFYKELWDTLHSTGYWEGEIWNRKKSGELFPEWINISVLKNKNGSPINYIAIFSDISFKKEAEEKIIHYAYYDPLTNLPNRRFFIEQLKQAIVLSKRNQQKPTILFIDLDDFKKINDQFGHAVGDVYLCKVAHLMKSKLRESDIVSRFGGDEFVLLLSNIQSKETALKFSQQLLTHLESSMIQVENNQLFVKASIGSAIYPDNGVDAESLIRYADMEMYEIKAKRKQK